MATKSNYTHYNAEQPIKISIKDLAWLAAMIEAEGSITSQVTFRKTGNISVVPMVQFTNNDKILVDEVTKILRNIGANVKIAQRKGGTYNLRVDRHHHVRIILEAIIPYIRGFKSNNAQIVLEYCIKRKGQPKHNKIPKEDIIKLCSIRTHRASHSIERCLLAPNIG